MASKKTVTVFLGSVRPNRQCERVARFVCQKLREKFHVFVLDPEELAFPLLKKPIHFHGPNEVPPADLVAANKKVNDADCLVVITGEYNRCIPPALTNLMDHFAPNSYKYKPTAVVHYSMGYQGGLVAFYQVVAFLNEVGGFVIPTHLAIPSVHENLDENGNPANERFPKNLAKLITELIWYTNALSEYKNKNGIPE